MKKLVQLFVVSWICTSTFLAPTFAGGRRSPSASPRPTAAGDTNDRITALNLTSVIVTIYATHQSKEYKVTPATRITVNGRPNALSDLAAGMDVIVTPLLNDVTTAASIDAKTPARR
jgi:hypothetical protein